jgi:chorismate mutase/prephenate dehydrogenase
MADLETLRNQIQNIDRDILQLIQKRTEIARSIGEEKQRSGAPLKNYEVEKQVYERVENTASNLGVAPETARDVFSSLIQESVAAQEKDRYRATDQDTTSLVIGGEGKMGSWFTEYLSLKGHSVETMDVNGTPDHTRLPDQLNYDFIAICTPIDHVEPVLQRIENTGTDAVVADMASLKQPFKHALTTSKLAVTSFHPLFGPDVQTLAEHTVLLCSVGNEEADRFVHQLFADTAAQVETVDINAHDDHQTYTLTLSHLANYVFADTLATGEKTLGLHRRFTSSTAEKQLTTSLQVLRENPSLYREIQNATEKQERLYNDFQTGIHRFQQALCTKESFEAYVKKLRSHYEE